MYINWTPTRALVGAGSDGKIEISLQRFDREMKTIAKESRALDGTTETTLHRIDFTSPVQTVPTSDAALKAKFREFASSVAAGETFTFDALGTEASPDNAINVAMVMGTYKENRESVLYFSYSFKVREL